MAETAGERLQALMATQKIKSAAEVSRRSGVPESTIRTYLLGTRNMSFDSARKFALALGVNPEWLYDGKGSMSDRAPPTQPVSAPEARSGYTAPPQFFDGNDLRIGQPATPVIGIAQLRDVTGTICEGPHVQ